MAIVSLITAVAGLIFIGIGAKIFVVQHREGRPPSLAAIICLADGVALLAFAIWNSFISRVF
jgi:UDP-N-acetylmuramyl pentapeptide phosphotransferase/UDP-N-acetylglucosamine-1-phosphate transferase